MVKICILSCGRAGTNLLLYTLGNHPDIRPPLCEEPFGAVLRSFEYYLPFIKDELKLSFDDKIGQPYPNMPPVIKSREHTYKYLDYVFENQDVIKILYDHIEYNEHILQYLIDHPDIKIINLYRVDTVSAYLSLLKLTQQIENSVRIWINEEHYNSIVSKWNDIREQLNVIFKEYMLETSFENLISNWHTVITDILTYVNVRPQQLAMATLREGYMPPEYYIHNPQLITKLRQLTDPSSYLFTEYLNVFKHAKPLFEKFLQPYIDKEAHFLEIGSFEGRASNWMLTYILTHPESTLTCVDIWIYTWEAAKLIYDFFIYNTSKFGDKVAIYRGLSSVVVPKFLYKQYDFIYIDGSHVDVDMLEDTKNAYALLKPGGIIAIDDYNLVHADYTKGTVPKILLDQFLEQHSAEIDILHQDYQLWFRKK